MSNDNQGDSAETQSLHVVLAEYIRRRDAGEPVNIESFCRAYPELADGLRSYAEGEGLLDALGESSPAVSSNARSAETLRPGAAQRTDFAPESEFGRYRLLRQLGNGAMGAVYLAEDTHLGRRVALKIPTSTGTEGSEFLKRFTREAQAAARLEHPNLCRVYDFGDVNGTPYITMEYIDGGPLSDCVGQPILQDQRRVVEIMIGIAAGLQCAHEQGILHRDVKCGNVLMKHGESPCVTDFGLARIEDRHESKITQNGSILGTPAYMAPEQIRSEHDRIGPSSDVYALGVVFYELLTGQVPFQGPALVVLNQALHDRPKPVQTSRSGVDRQLDKYCLQMLEKEPENRPQSMQTVIEFFSRWLEATSPENLAEREKADQERSKYHSMKEKVVELVRGRQYPQALAALESMQRLSGAEAQEYIAWAREKIPEVKKRSRQNSQNALALLSTAKQCLRRRDYAQVIQLLEQVPAQTRTPEEQKTLEHALVKQEECDLLLFSIKDCLRTRQLDGIEDDLKRFLKLKPGNKFAKELWQSLQTYRKIPRNSRRYQFDDRGRLQPHSTGSIWENWLVMGTLCFAFVFGVVYWGITLYLNDGTRTLAVEVNDDWLREQGGQLTLDIDGKEHTITAGDMEVKVTFGDHGFSVKHGDAVVHSPQRFSIAKGSKQILHIDASGMRLASRSEPPTQTSGDERIADRTPIVVDAPLTPLPDGPAGFLQTLDGHTGSITGLGFAPDGKTLATVSAVDKSLRIWDLKTGQTRHVINAGIAYGLAIDPTGKWVVVSSEGEAKVFRLDSGKLETRVTWIGEPAYASSFSLDGKRLALHIPDDGVKIYDLSAPKNPSIEMELPGAEKSKDGWAGAVRFLPDGDHLLVSSPSADYATKLFHLPSRRELKTFRSKPGDGGTTSYTLGLHPDGRSVALIANHSWQLMRFDLQGETQNRTYSVWGGRTVIFARDGRHLISGDVKDGERSGLVIRLADDGSVIWEGRLSSDIPNLISDACLDISPDGRFVAAGRLVDQSQNRSVDLKGIPNPIYLWRLPKEVWPRRKADSQIAYAAPKTPIADGPPGEVVKLTGHTGSIRGIATSPDGNSLCSISPDQTARLWDVATGTCRAIISVPEIPWTLAYAPDSQHVAIATKSGVIICDASNGGRVATLSSIDPAMEKLAAAVAFSPDGRKLAIYSEDDLQIWDITSVSQPKPSVTCATEKTTWAHESIQFDSSSQYLYVADAVVGCRRYRTDTGALDKEFVHPGSGEPLKVDTRGLSLSTDGKEFAIKTYVDRDVVNIIDVRSGEIKSIIQTKGTPMLLNGGQRLLTGRERHLEVRSRQGQILWKTDQKTTMFQAYAVFPDERFIASGGGEYWEPKQQKMVVDSDFDIHLWRLPKHDMLE